MLPRLSAPVSGVDCPCPWFHANSLLLASLLSSRQLPSAGSRCQLPSAGSRRQLSFASPSHFRIRRDFRSKNPLSGFAPKQTKESSALAAHPHSATHNLHIYKKRTKLKLNLKILDKSCDTNNNHLYIIKILIMFGYSTAHKQVHS